MGNYRKEARALLKRTLMWNLKNTEKPLPWNCIPHSHYGDVKPVSNYSSSIHLSERANRLRQYMASAGYITIEDRHDLITASGTDFAESTVFSRHQFWFGIVLGASLS